MRNIHLQKLYDNFKFKGLKTERRKKEEKIRRKSLEYSPSTPQVEHYVKS